jgi:hypothetical protein
MTEPRPERPPLVIAICVYEIFAIVWHIMLRLSEQAILAIHPQIVNSPTPAWQTPASYLSLTLALFAAITLWQMRSSAALLLAGRFVITLIWIVIYQWHGAPYRPARPGHISPATINLIIRCYSFIVLILSAAITWYAYRVTRRPPGSSTETFSAGDRPAWPQQP